MLLNAPNVSDVPNVRKPLPQDAAHKPLEPLKRFKPSKFTR
jgi:hypothetical protein